MIFSFMFQLRHFYFQKNFPKLPYKFEPFKRQPYKMVKHTQIICFLFSKLGSHVKNALPNQQISHGFHEILISLPFRY